MLDYDFLWAKMYIPEARTFSSVEQFLNVEIRLFNLGPRKLSIVCKVFLLTLRYSCEIVGYA